MNKEIIGKIDWVAVLQNLPTDPIALLSFIVLLTGIVSVIFFRNSSNKQKMSAFVLILLGAGAAFYAVAQLGKKELMPQPSVNKVSEAMPIPEKRMIERKRELSFYDRNDHCAATRQVYWDVTADEGWKIDVTSIEPIVTVKSSNSSFGGVLTPTESGFKLSGKISNSGTCGPFWKDGRGALGVTVSFTEFKYE